MPVPKAFRVVRGGFTSLAGEVDNVARAQVAALRREVGALRSAETYTPSNVTADRAYDANATTVDELADVLGTLIADLQATGIIS